MKQDRIQESYFLKLAITVALERALELRNRESHPITSHLLLHCDSPEKTKPFKHENQNIS